MKRRIAYAAPRIDVVGTTEYDSAEAEDRGTPSPPSAPIFIAGLDRCGKTTMRAFLVSHPNIAIPSVGSNMWRYFYRRFGSLEDDGNLDRCLEAMLRYKHVRFLEPDPIEIRQAFLSGPRTYPRLFALFLEQFANAAGKPRWGVQSGLVEVYADELLTAYPGAKVIHMIRDPRDRYEASVAKWPNGKGRAGGAAARWRYTASLAHRNQERHSSRYLTVRFEDMVRSPEKTIESVCEFIGEIYDPAMLSMGDAEKHRRQLAQGSNGASGLSPLSTDFIGRYRDRVDDREIAFIELAGGRWMERYGYELERVQLGALRRVRFALGDVPSQLARLVAWRTREELQDRLPTVVPRQPAAKMILEPWDGGP